MGPLHGYRIIEIAGIGPGPFCAMLLSDQGAEVVRVDRPPAPGGAQRPVNPVLNRGRPSLALDLKRPEGVAALLRMVERADALFEGFRPGVMERLGVGPEPCRARNPRLVYGRMTGWGQEGPLAQAAGHDLNYIALAGALYYFGAEGGPPAQPLNILGDFAGGGMLLAMGILAALLERERSGEGQVVDAAMVDGTAALMASFWGQRAWGTWRDGRGVNRVSGATHYYQTYQTADGEYVSVAAMEPQFYAELLRLTGTADPAAPTQEDPAGWSGHKARLAELFRTRTRAEWCALLEGSDACFAPVLTMEEARAHPHNRARKVFIEVDGLPQPAPAPRFSRTRPETPRPAAQPGAHSEAVLAGWGFSAADIAALRAAGAIA